MRFYTAIVSALVTQSALAVDSVRQNGGGSKSLRSVAALRVCPDDYEPICASNGVTYNSTCAFEKAQYDDHSLALVAHGACPEGCEQYQMHFTLYDPVCASNGQTYSSRATFDLAKCLMGGDANSMRIVNARGECAKGCEDLQSHMEVYDPICANNGMTYPSVLDLKYEQCISGSRALTKAYDGECDDCGACTESYDPVCGSDGQTYSNLCEFKRSRCVAHDVSMTVVSNGECAPGCDTQCPMMFAPVCGSNGEEYSNECFMRQVACLSRDNALFALHAGECQQADCDAIVCPKNYEPVCGSDGNVYTNECMLRKAHCADPSLSLSLTDDACKQEKPDKDCVCTEIYDPVCAMHKDGSFQTFSNACEAECSETKVMRTHHACEDPCLEECPQEPEECFVEPCDTARQPHDGLTNSSALHCENDHCGGCRARWFADGSCHEPRAPVTITGSLRRSLRRRN